MNNVIAENRGYPTNKKNDGSQRFVLRIIRSLLLHDIILLLFFCIYKRCTPHYLGEQKKKDCTVSQFKSSIE